MSNLISDDYKSLNARLHKTSNEYGNVNNFLARELPTSISILRKLYNYQSVLDYGCGKGLILDSLSKKLEPLGMNIQGYDPCIEKFSESPKRADILLCTDVLEHVEPEKTNPLNISYSVLAMEAFDVRNCQVGSWKNQKRLALWLMKIRQ